MQMMQAFYIRRKPTTKLLTNLNLIIAQPCFLSLI